MAVGYVPATQPALRLIGFLHNFCRVVLASTEFCFLLA